MKNCKSIIPVGLLLGAVFSTSSMAAQSEALKLADIHGCVACHSLTPEGARKHRKSVLPLGPSFKEISERFYSSEGGDYQELYRIVKYGSSPYRSKWQGKISGLAMPPNDDTISDLDINRLLVWILTAFEAPKK